ncbi:hypothetical protein DAPPUDRAFT_267693 [Daphnia pulex]|uniref:Uncharacterized protein n=1 Tax=Daphnia pulex TaxID=6669 RepID=E9HWU9_DAPPU|nr:hypothetical protein DAPPUDRAFT_267693 [Daphnia pulex]|eukprot:EFX63781.1 hypothetical protein DAPPUDRAFT_267693 [Daphnia pulex]
MFSPRKSFSNYQPDVNDFDRDLVFVATLPNTPEVSSPVPEVVTEFFDVFTGLGKLPVEHTIKLSTGNNAVDPVISAAGRLPFRLEETVRKKLD